MERLGDERWKWKEIVALGLDLRFGEKQRRNICLPELQDDITEAELKGTRNICGVRLKKAYLGNGVYVLPVCLQTPPCLQHPEHPQHLKDVLQQVKSDWWFWLGLPLALGAVAYKSPVRAIGTAGILSAGWVGYCVFGTGVPL